MICCSKPIPVDWYGKCYFKKENGSPAIRDAGLQGGQRWYSPSPAVFGLLLYNWSDRWVWMAAPSQPMAEHRMRDIRCNNKRSVPPSAWRHLQPKSRPPLRKEQKKKKKKHSHTREKSTCKPLRALRIKHTDLKLLLSRTFSPSFPLLAAAPEEVLRSAGHRLNFSPGLTPRALAQKNTGFTS